MRHLILSTAAAFATSAAVAQETTTPLTDFGFYHGHGAMWSDGPWGVFGMFFGSAFILLIVAGLVALLVIGLRSAGNTGSFERSVQSRDNSLSILKERFAKGEIDAKEFEERKRLLSD